jgi:hypothetical protein
LVEDESSLVEDDRGKEEGEEGKREGEVSQNPLSNGHFDLLIWLKFLKIVMGISSSSKVRVLRSFGSHGARLIPVGGTGCSHKMKI